MESKQTAGRPRDDDSDTQLKNAARRLVTKLGYEKVSITKIIQEADVARQTLYRRWPSKADLVLDAFFEVAGKPPANPDAAGLTVRSVLEQFLIDVYEGLAKHGDAIRSLIAAAQSDPVFCESFNQKFVQPREQMVLDLLTTAQTNGEISNDMDITMASWMIHGAFWYRMLNGEVPNEEFARSTIAMIFDREMPINK